MNGTKISDAIDVMIRTEHMHKSLIDMKAKTIGVHRTQHRILMTLSRCGRLPSQKELAEMLDITPAAVTLAIKKLELLGLVSRAQGKDNRYLELEITVKGKEIVKETKKLFSEADIAIFDGFSEEELDIYVLFLEKMQNNMKNQLVSKIEGGNR